MVKIKDKKTIIVPKYNFVLGCDASIEGMQKLADAAAEGNIPSMIQIINHNQMVISHKLNKLLEKKNDKKEEKKE